jgi:hypothetical protein
MPRLTTALNHKNKYLHIGCVLRFSPVSAFIEDKSVSQEIRDDSNTQSTG